MLGVTRFVCVNVNVSAAYITGGDVCFLVRVRQTVRAVTRCVYGKGMHARSHHTFDLYGTLRESRTIRVRLTNTRDVLAGLTR